MKQEEAIISTNEVVLREMHNIIKVSYTDLMVSIMRAHSLVSLSSYLLFLTVMALCNCCLSSERTLPNAVCIENEGAALLQLKKSLVDRANRLSSWAGVGENDCCKWAGVICDNYTGHVTEIHLDGSDYDTSQRLGGEINPSLLNLKQLEYLDLSSNNFTGAQIPSFFGSLGNLRYLNLSGSGFSGMIPYQLGNLSSLHVLDLASLDEDDHFVLRVKNLQWLSSLYLLHHLDMTGVDLSSAYNWLLVISELPFLQELHLSSCGLGNVPLPPLLPHSNLTALEILDLSENNFNACLIPEWIFSLNSLVSLDLSGCYFRGSNPSSAAFRNMSSLRLLHISRNDFSLSSSSSVLKSLSSLSSLVSLHMSWCDCELAGPFPDSLQNISNSLVDLIMVGNYFTSTITSWLFTFSRLETLNLWLNELQGGISGAVGNLTSLVYLRLDENKLTGRLPKQLGTLCNLKMINFEGNRFDGSVSEVLESFSECESPRLEELYLAANQLSGHLPDQLGKLNNLVRLYLGKNSISGPIPDSIGRLSSLEELGISHNGLNGTLPESLGQLASLNFLGLDNNLLAGALTENHFVNLTNLRELDARYNTLTLKPSLEWVPAFQLHRLFLTSWNLGPKFPSWLRWQGQLVDLDIANTGIADTIPSWFWSTFSSLEYFNVSHNQIHGNLTETTLSPSTSPQAVFDLSSNHFSGPLPIINFAIVFLDLSNNTFSGSLELFLCHRMDKQKQLQALNLGNNLLSGVIPDCWRNWPSLLVLDFESNNLSGGFPPSLGYLSKLMAVNMRKNKLSKSLSLSPLNLTELQILDISANEFGGSVPTWIGTQLRSLMVLNLRHNKFEGSIPDELCGLTSIQILDLGHNNLFGTIPRCFNKFRVMATKNNSNSLYVRSYISSYTGAVIQGALAVTKGEEVEYSTILGLVKILDLSSNNFTGEIPDELMSLIGLLSLNMSGNHLTGRIPEKIGEMTLLESLDLSKNRLYGEIPLSMSSLNFLSRLNLSYNNLSGRIPTSTQLQSLDESSFIGNRLCGAPLRLSCGKQAEPVPEPRDGNGDKRGCDDHHHEVDWGFVICILVGFGVGFWGVVAPLIVSRVWRILYFGFLDNMRYKLYDVICKCCNVFSK